MKRRNYLLALTLLALFAALGVVYFRAFVVPKPFGVILFIGDGLVSANLTAARLYDGGADHRLAIGSLPNVALLSTHAADFAVPDAASAASALACGIKTNHRALSVDPAGTERATLLEIARQQGRATGLVTNGRLTDPAPAAFYAHTVDCRDRGWLANQLVYHAGLDVVLGLGDHEFIAPRGGGVAPQWFFDRITKIQADGYALLRGQFDLSMVRPYNQSKLFGAFDESKPSVRDAPNDMDARPPLADMVQKAVEILQRRVGGYLLVVDAGQIGRAALANDGERTVQEILELDRAVSVALQYAGSKTLVIVAGGEATGGMALNGYPLRGDHGVSLLGMNAEGLPSITWATGPAGPGPAGSPAPAPAAFYSPYAANVADDALAAGFGPGSERLRGFQDNTFIFELIRSRL